MEATTDETWIGTLRVSKRLTKKTTVEMIDNHVKEAVYHSYLEGDQVGNDCEVKVEEALDSETIKGVFTVIFPIRVVSTNRNSSLQLSVNFVEEVIRDQIQEWYEGMLGFTVRIVRS